MSNTPTLPPSGYAPDPDCLKDRVIAITGASDGVGRAVAERCATLGATVILHGRVERKLNEVYDAIEAAGGPEPALLPVDMESADKETYENVETSLKATLGKLDGLVHCAAQLGQLAPLGLSDPAQWQKTLNVNLTGAYQMTRILLPFLQAAPAGRIIFAEDRQRASQAYWGAYGAAEGGRRALRDMLAHELEGESPLRVFGAQLPPLRTRLRLQAFPGADASEWAAPSTVADGFVYLLSEANAPKSNTVNIQSL